MRLHLLEEVKKQDRVSLSFERRISVDFLAMVSLQFASQEMRVLARDCS
jgi:hypothetical protein